MKKILCSLALASIPVLSIAPIVSCGNTQKYSDLVKTAVNKLVDLDKYPRCTSTGNRSNLDAIRVWIIKEAIQSGVSYTNIHSNGYGNIWFDVNASQGYEDYKMLVLQGHMDMVVAGLTDETKTTTPIDVEVEWDKGIVHSKDYKTSLGADDGIALAIIFTLIQDSNFKHGPLRVIFTADEDSGMGGASYIADNNPYIVQKTGPLNLGDDIEYLLNIDAEGLGEIYRSSLGSETITYSGAFDPSTETALSNKLCLEVKGLKGGHSGDIGQKMASAEKFIYEILNSVNNKQIQLVKHFHPDPDKPEDDISFQRNQVVPHAKLLFNTSLSKKTISDAIESKIAEWKNIYTAEDWTKVQITINDSSDTAEHDKYLSAEQSNLIINKLGSNNNPISMDTTENGGLWYGAELDENKNIIKSSNISPVEIEYDKDTKTISVTMVSQFRTKTNTILDEMDNYYKKIQLLKYSIGSYYPAWELNTSRENKIISMVSKSFADQSVEANVLDANGGMENSFWALANPEINCTGIGPTIKNAHSVNETLYIDTIQPIINAVKYVCEQMKK